MSIRTAPIRQQIADLLRRRINSGQLAPGLRLDEMELSKRLGVSRTPLREALVLLEHEGLIRHEPNRSRRVAAIDEAVVREIYPILGELEALAVRLGGVPEPEELADLRERNERIRRAESRGALHKLDHAWHDRLLSRCNNPTLLGLIATLRSRAARFDGASRRGMAQVEGSCAEHRAVLDSLAAEDVDGAADRMRTHWLRGIDVVVAWLESRGDRP